MSSNSTLYYRLAPPVQKWLHAQNWPSLRPVQEMAGPVILDGYDCIISASTAGGKTEAAFLPLLSRAFETKSSPEGAGVPILYISPLKALINDQYARLEHLGELTELSIIKWHGDAPQGPKTKTLKRPAGIVLITPESLEAILMRHPLKLRQLFAGLQSVIIDEFHAFLGMARGQQLLSQLDRIEQEIQRRVQRVALSATLGEPEKAKVRLRPRDPESVVVVSPEPTKEREILLQVRGYEHKRPAGVTANSDDLSKEAESNTDKSVGTAIATHLYNNLRGDNHLIFGGSRGNVEVYSASLREKCESARVPNEFFPHHGNLSKDHREFVEKRMKDEHEPPTSAICTSTLEMGIDIGKVKSIAELGPPHSVSSMLQRLGRSGRRGEPSTVRFYISEFELDNQLATTDRLRPSVFQTMACVELMLDDWCETPQSDGLDLSTLVHQILSLIVQTGGTQATMLYRMLSEQGAFKTVSKKTFIDVLHSIANHESPLIEQSKSGLIMLAEQGEAITDHYSFYAVFETPIEFRVQVIGGQNLGMMPLTVPYRKGDRLVFAGKRWVIEDIDDLAKVILVSPKRGGKPPMFVSNGPPIDCKIAKKMLALYQSAREPGYLDRNASKLFDEGIAAFDMLDLMKERMLQQGSDVLIFTWTGTYATLSLMYFLKWLGFEARFEEHFALVVEDTEIASIVNKLQSTAIPDLEMLVQGLEGTGKGKFAEFLSDDLNAEAFVANNMLVQKLLGLVHVLLED